MTFRRRLIWTSGALVAALTIGVPSSAGAQARGAGPAAGGQAPAGQGQGQGRGRGAPPYTPAAGAKDLKAVLFNWAIGFLGRGRPQRAVTTQQVFARRVREEQAALISREAAAFRDRDR